MTDIGFGLIDKRTVIVVLFTVVIAQILFQLPMPIDTTNAGNLFIDLVLLTGYVYLARSLYRLPLALIGSSYLSYHLTRDYISDWRIDFGKLDSSKEIKFKALRKIVRLGSFVISLPLVALVSLLIYVFTFGDWDDKTTYAGEVLLRRGFSDAVTPIRKHLLNIIDRIGLIAISFAAALPAISGYVRFVGAIGLIVMGLIFAIRGDFTALVKDMLDKDKEKDKQEPVEVRNSQWHPLYVEVVNKVETTNQPVEIKSSEFFPISVEVVNRKPINVASEYGKPLNVASEYGKPLEVEASSQKPFLVYVANLPPELGNLSAYPLRVEVTNIVETRNADENGK